MIAFTLPRLHPELYQYIDISCNVDTRICDEKQYYLENIEKSIKNVRDEWEIYKKITNTYEMLYSNIPFENHRVSNLNKSKTFFVITDIYNNFFLPIINNDDSITTFHFHDNSNGMIDAFIDMRKNNKNDTYISLKTDISPSVGPMRGREDIKDCVNENITFCELQNIFDLNSFKYVTDKFKSSIDCITADIDINGNYYIAEICYALCIQKKNGNFTLKFLNTYTKKSIDIIGLLSSMYEEVYLTKPLSCENYSSESYLVCKNFLHNNSDNFYPQLLTYFTMVLNNENFDNLAFFINTSCINESFSNKIKEYSTILSQYQIEHIHNTLNIISTDKNKNLCIHSSFRSTLPNEVTEESVFFNKSDFGKSKVQYLLNINIKKCVQFCNNHHINVDKVILDNYT